MARLIFSEDFFKSEIREEFLVSEMMKRCWGAQMEVLSDIDELCKKHGIRWFADWGTLLGAVRHKGFIPWDDDIDIAMLKDDYIRFMYYAKLELSDKYHLLNVYTDGEWGMPFCRIVNSKALTIERDYLTDWHGCPLSVGLDVFPYYYIPRDKTEEEKQMQMLETIEALQKVNNYIKKLNDEARNHEAEELKQAIAENLVILEKQTGYVLEQGRTLEEQLDIISEQIMRFYDDLESDRVTQYCYYIGNRSFWMDKKWFEETVMLPFETMFVPVPKNYEEVLTKMYGDWKKPVKNSAGHGYPYFADQIRALKNDIEKSELMVQRKLLINTELYVPTRQELNKSQNEKCVILMYTGIREMLIYSEHVLEKLRRVFEFCEQNKDKVELYWIPAHFEYNKKLPFEMMVPELIKGYNDLIEYYKENNIGICDETGDINKAIDNCDCYWGDASFISDLFKLTGKPVLIQDYRITDFCGKISDYNVNVDMMITINSNKYIGCAKNRNGLFEIDSNLKKCTYLTLIRDEISSGVNLFSDMLLYGNNLFLVPCAAKNIVIYDIDTGEMDLVPVGIDDQSDIFDQSKFGKAYIFKGYAYMFGARYSYILRMNMETHEIKKIEIPTENTWSKKAIIRERDQVFILADGMKCCLSFDLQTEKVEIIEQSEQKQSIWECLINQLEKESKQDLKFLISNNINKYMQDVFESYTKDACLVISEQENWIGPKELVEYVAWRKLL